MQREAESAESESWWSKLLGFAADLLRAVELAVLFSPAALTLPLAWFAGGRLWRWWIILSLRLVQRAGPTFVKLGQWASTRPDVFPVDMCHTFSALHDDVAPMSFREVQHVLEDELGVLPASVFESLDPVPVGQGCIAQVHKGRLRSDPSRVVAVKVQRPGVRRAFERDVRLMESTAQLLTWMIPSLRWLCLSECVGRFEDFMYSQLDFRVEADHLRRFRSNFSKDNTVVFPTPIRWSRRVLVESFEPGPSITEFMGHQSDVRKSLAGIGLRTFLQMVLVDNFVHTDLHPGNMKVKLGAEASISLTRADNHRGAANGAAQLVVLDAGLVTELDEQDRVNFVDLFEAVAMGDGRRAGHLMITRTPDQHCIDEDAFLDTMHEIVGVVRDRTFNLGDVQIGLVLRRVMDAARNYHVKIDPTFTQLLVGIVTLEGVGRQLDPDVDIFREALPMLRRARREYQSAMAGVGLARLRGALPM